MTMCTEPGCPGQIAADGYCDTCGSKASVSPASAPSAPAAPSASSGGAASSAAPAMVAGSACTQPGCTGTIAADGYCDTCGMAVESTAAPIGAPSGAGAPPSGAPPSVTPSGSTPSIAAPQAPDVSGRLSRSGSSGSQSRRTVTSTRTTSSRTGVGVGLVAVAPTPVGDPAQAVMGEEDVRRALGIVPEEERTCSNCGRPVGRSSDGRPGRVKGFCGSCRTSFDFVTNEPTLAAGDLVAGQYQILGPLAHGGLGWVYLGQDKAVSDRWVVLKGLLNQSDPDAALAAVAERQFLAQIEHPNIVNIYNFVTHRGAGYIVMEMVGGESLNAKLKQRRRDKGGQPDPLPPAEAIAYVLGILPAFGYLHERGLVFNDLKPDNIMAVGQDVKLIDVGAVMRADDEQAAIFGTIGFQAPEVAADGPSPTSDLYTVGRTLAVLMMNFRFHDGPYLYALPERENEPLLAQWESLHRFLLRACAFHRDDRFQTAAEMAEQLTGVLREMVAVTEGKPRVASSTLFETDQLSHLLVASSDPYDVNQPDWRVLPTAKIDEDDPAAAFLSSLPDNNPGRAVESVEEALKAGQVQPSAEVRVHQAKELVRAEVSPEEFLAEVEKANPWDWRVPWYRSLFQLQLGLSELAAEGFSKVWTELPGEMAPKLGVALAAEMAGQYERAAEVYDLVASVDSAYVSAAFGLARCRVAMGQQVAVVEALNRVPPSSAAHSDAQVAIARQLVAGGPDGPPSMDQLADAAETIERLQLDAAERAALSADVFERALAGVQIGQIPAGDAKLLGWELNEKSLRLGLEETYRAQARLAPTTAERFKLVDKANEIRPRSLL